MSDEESGSVSRTREKLLALVRHMKAEGTTPYGSEQCLYTQQLMELASAALILRQKGHAETADHVEAELEHIQSTPGLETDILAYIQAMADQTRLCVEVWNYAEEHPELAEVESCLLRFATRSKSAG